MITPRVLDALLMMEFLTPPASESNGHQGLNDLKETNPEKQGDLPKISESAC